MVEKPICGTCKYWQRYTDDEQVKVTEGLAVARVGECHGNPPEFYVDLELGEQKIDIWPVCSADQLACRFYVKR